MILRLFKRNTSIQFVILLITIILLWFQAFIHPRPMPLPELITPVWGIIYDILCDLPVVYTLIAVMLVFGGSLLLNILLSEYGLVPRNSYLGAFVYIILMSCSPRYLTLYPVLVVNIFIIISMRMIFVLNQKEDALKEIFGAGILTAICSLFVFKTAGLFIGIWLFPIILRVFNWRKWVAGLFGFVSIYLYLCTWYLFTDQLLIKLQLYQMVIQSIKLVPWTLHLSVYEYILFFTILALIFIAIVHFLFNVNEKLISIRRISLVLLWLFMISTATSLFYIIDPVFDFSYLLLPISFMASIYLSNLKKFLFAEILLWVVLISIILCKI